MFLISPISIIYISLQAMIYFSEMDALIDESITEMLNDPFTVMANVEEGM